MQVYSDVFHTLSVDRARVPASTKRKNKLGRQDRTFQLTSNDYTMGDRKIGGNAQAIISKRWLHHTSFLWDYSEARMALLKEPERRPEYRGDRKHETFIAALSAYGFCRQEFTDTIEDAFVCQGFELDHAAGCLPLLSSACRTVQAQSLVCVGRVRRLLVCRRGR